MAGPRGRAIFRICALRLAGPGQTVCPGCRCPGFGDACFRQSDGMSVGMKRGWRRTLPTSVFDKVIDNNGCNLIIGKYNVLLFKMQII